MIRVVLAASALLAVPTFSAAQHNCSMSERFKQPDAHGSISRPVLSDELRTVFAFKDSLAANTDGTERSYSVSDFWGTGESIDGRGNNALNNLCNAMSDKCANMTSQQMRERRILTQSARRLGWPTELTARTKISPSIIMFKNGKPCESANGYLVNATALSNPRVADKCDQSKYLDSLSVKSIVVPRGTNGFSANQIGLGDIAIVWRPGISQPIYAIVGDAGPKRELGEASLAVNKELNGLSGEPKNYLNVRGRGAFVGQSWVSSTALVLIFKGDAGSNLGFPSQADIDRAGSQKLADFGGVARLQACFNNPSFRP